MLQVFFNFGRLNLLFLKIGKFPRKHQWWWPHRFWLNSLKRFKASDFPCLHFKSVHPTPLKKNILYYQAPQFNHLNDHQEDIQRENIEESTKTTFVMTYSRTLPDLRKVLEDNWSLLIINNLVKHVFNEKTIVAYCRNKNLTQPARNISGIFAVCSLSVVMFGTSREHFKGKDLFKGSR